MNLAGPLVTPLGLSQWKRASSRVEAGTSGFLSNSDSDRSVPAEFGQESQALSFLRNGTPLASRVVHGVSGPLSNCVWNLQVLPDDAWGWQCPFVLCLHPQGCLRRGVRASCSYEERTGKSGRSAFGTTHVASLEFPNETGLILRCAAKVMKPFQTKQRNRPSCGDQEGRSGSDEVLLGTSVFPSSETGMSGSFWGRIKRSKYRFAIENGKLDFSWGAPAGKGLILE